MKPQRGYLKFNVDTTINQSRRRMGFCCIVRNEEICFVVTKNFVQEGIYHMKIVEVVGLREALSQIKSLGFELIHVEMDALQVVKDF